MERTYKLTGEGYIENIKEFQLYLRKNEETTGEGIRVFVTVNDSGSCGVRLDELCKQQHGITNKEERDILKNVVENIIDGNVRLPVFISIKDIFQQEEHNYEIDGVMLWD